MRMRMSGGGGSELDVQRLNAVRRKEKKRKEKKRKEKEFDLPSAKTLRDPLMMASAHANAHIDPTIRRTRRCKVGASYGGSDISACQFKYRWNWLKNYLMFVFLGTLLCGVLGTGTRTLQGRYVSLEIGVAECVVTDPP